MPLAISFGWLLRRPHPLPLVFGEHAAEGGKFARALKPFAAIHRDHFAVDETGIIADQECGKVRELLGRAEALHRDAFLREFFEFRTRQQARERTLGWNWAGRDCV